MPTAAAALLDELEREARPTRKILARVPGDKLAWKPHPKSMTLGQLAGHVAGIPGGMARRARGEGMDMPQSPPGPAQPDAGVDFVAKLDAGISEARELLSTLEDDEAFAPWRMTAA
ncbi:MAG: DinB family protein, partial [Acidobacteriota bacterium]|nr:DinB family protein [Acidobacteriota bacterium]